MVLKRTVCILEMSFPSFISQKPGEILKYYVTSCNKPEQNYEFEAGHHIN